MNIGDFITTYKGKATIFAMDRDKLMSGRDGQVQLSPMILSCGFYRDFPMKDYTVIDITFIHQTNGTDKIYLDFNGNELFDQIHNQPSAELKEYLHKQDLIYDGFLADCDKIALYKRLEKIENDIKKLCVKVEDNHYRFATKDIKFDKEGAEMGFAFYPKDSVLDSLKMFRNKYNMAIGSLIVIDTDKTYELSFGFSGGSGSGFSCSLSSLIEKIEELPFGVALSGHIAFLCEKIKQAKK